MPKRNEPKQLTPEEAARFDKLSEITEEDKERAKAAWRQDAPAGFADLLDATDDDDAVDTAK